MRLHSEESSDDESTNLEPARQNLIKEKFRELMSRGEYSLECSDESDYSATLIANYMLMNAVRVMQNIRKRRGVGEKKTQRR